MPCSAACISGSAETIQHILSEKELHILEGDIPSPVNPPDGCKFHTRCEHCTEICRHVVPTWEEVSPGHYAACHHMYELQDKWKEKKD